MNSYNPMNYLAQNNTNNTSSLPMGGTLHVPRIRVVVRKRPLTQKEKKRGDIDVLEVKSNKALIVKEIK